MKNKISDVILNLIYPPRCPACDGVSEQTGMPCRMCAAKFVPITGAVCALCGKPVESDAIEYCANCTDTPRYFDGGIAVYKYKDVASAVLRFKNNGRPEYGRFFSDQMCIYAGQTITAWKPNALIPIPISDKKFKSRGYNQAHLLAKPLGKQLKIPVAELMIRIDTGSDQKILNLAQRSNNISGAFKILQNSVQLESAVLIDDVYTTGATLNEAAGCLKNFGVRKVYFAVLASGE